MTAEELNQLADRLVLGETTVEDDADVLRVIRAVAKLEEMRRSHTNGWHIQSGSNFTLISNFGCSIEDAATIVEAIENYKEQS